MYEGREMPVLTSQDVPPSNSDRRDLLFLEMTRVAGQSATLGKRR